jgi:hypothetical protein
MNCLHRKLQFVAAMAILTVPCGIGLASSLTWNSGGSTPTHPHDGNGPWDTTSKLWSNGTADTTWVNDGTESAIFGNDNGQGGGVTVTTTINVAGIMFNPAAPGYDELEIHSSGIVNVNGDISSTGTNTFYSSAVELNGGTLNMMGHDLTGPFPTQLFLDNGTLLNLNSVTGGGEMFFGSITIGGTNSFTNPIDPSGSVHLQTGGTLGNTPITLEPSGQFSADVGTSAGSTGAGTAGASLILESKGLLTIGGNGTAGAFTLNQQSGFSGPALNLEGGTMTFSLTPGGSTELVENGIAASVSNVNTVDLLANGGLTALTPGDTYTLISDPAGGLSGTFEFSNGTDEGEVVIGGHGYFLKLEDSPTALTATVLPGVVPEPASLAVLGVSGALLLGRRRR